MNMSNNERHNYQHIEISRSPLEKLRVSRKILI